MSDWQERITRETAPAIRAEHELRYTISAPLVLPDGPWVDLGCGNGVAAHAAFGECPRMRAVLVDLDEAAVARATRELALPDATGVAADLTSTSDLERIGEAIASLGTPPVVTCFEVVEHLETFLPLLEWTRRLVAEHDATFLMSVPNDAFWSIQNPHHTTSWGEGAFEELRGLLPADATLLRQVSLSGSAIAPWEERTERHAIEVEVDGAVAVASHFIAAFGPRAAGVRGAAVALATDVLSQRAWERQRESALAVTQQLVREQAEELQRRDVWFEEWRTYIHKLERQLGEQLSGMSAEELPVESQDAPDAKDAPDAEGGIGPTAGTGTDPATDGDPG